MPVHAHVDAQTLQAVLQTVWVTGEPAIIAPSAFLGELDAIVDEVKKYGMKLASVPNGGITILPPLPVSASELFDFCADYCKARTREERLIVRHRINTHNFLMRDSVVRMPCRLLYNPADYILRIVHICGELVTASEEEYHKAYVIVPLLHISPVQDVCERLRRMFQSGSLQHTQPWVVEEELGDGSPERSTSNNPFSPDAIESGNSEPSTDGNGNDGNDGRHDDEEEGAMDVDLTGQETVDNTSGPVGEFLLEKDFEVVTESGIFYDESGERVQAIFVRGGIKKEICKRAAVALEAAATTKNLRKATNGGKTNPETGIVGYYDYLNNPTQRKCRETEFTRKNWSIIADPCENFLVALNRLYSECAPTHYKLQRIAIPQHYQLFNTVFSTVTVNRNFRTAVHTDSGDFRSGLAALCVIDGIFDGCHLAIKKLGKAFRIETGDVLFFDTSLEHGNTEVHNFDYCWKRVSVVCYMRTGLASQQCEMERRRRINRDLAKQLLLEKSRQSVVNLNKTDPKLPPLYVPWKLVSVLSPIQQSALGFIVDRLSKGNGCVLALTMGLGKTLVSLALCFSYLCQSSPSDILILAPKTVLTHWISEKQKWEQYGLVIPEFLVSDGTDSASFEVALKRYEQQMSGEVPRTSHVFVINPEYVKTFLRKLTGFRPSLMIVDEGHRVSSKGNKLKDILDGTKCSARVILSGTPVQNNAEELYRLIGWINSDVHSVLPPRVFTELAGSINRYINGDNSAFSAAVSAQRYIQDWMSSYVFSVMKADLPPLFDYIIICGLSSVQQKMFEDHLNINETVGFTVLKASEHRPYHLSTHPLCFLGFISGLYKSLTGTHRSAAEIVEEDEEKENEDATQSYTLSDDDTALMDDCLSLVNSGHLVEFVGLSGKLTVLISILHAIREKKEKAIIFSQYVGSQDFISRTLTSFDIVSSTIRGRDCHDRRRRTIEKFREDETITCLVLSTQIGAYGLDFTAANHVVMWDSWWNPQVETQAIARAYRRNQTKPVVVYRLASAFEDTVILNTQVRKLALFKCIMNEQTSRAVPPEELFDCVDSEEDDERRLLWLSLKASRLEGGAPAVSKIIRYDDTVRSESWK
ncbi:putative SNF2 DNA repair protein [Trypanosoma grayi]|uniref:putative SNF2 DNA repair protein n=1 Tax=Trypanosoma grayi TaxID=71804 RepID=UPI0004F42667|nr:putative SNF2 DNA repair protein [Trypanosoma grayi]KEG12757.1 putative SNF2 DNA repair protein [Trypanosoma grayi]